MPDSYKKELVICSTFEELEKLEPFVSSLQDRLSLSDEQYNRILLTLSEAVSNAILHGNDENPEKKVLIVSEFQQNSLEISVSDEGPGFDPLSLPDPLEEENLLNQGGRGVYLIKEYADKVSYSEDGAKITMHFALDG